jgi:hypothetical protein
MERACNDDADGLTTSTLQLSGLPAGTYNVVVDTKAAMSGTIPVDVYVTSTGPAGDRCGNPTFIAAGATSISGSTCGLGNDAQAAIDTDCDYSGSGYGPERIYYFYLPTARAVTFDGCTAGTDYDSTVYVRTVCTDPALAAQEGCNDDNCGTNYTCSDGYRSSLTTMLPAGLHYFFADGYDESGWACPCGNYQLDLTGI